MYILAFETSCDDTSIAIMKDNVLLAMDTKSQIKEHLETGGVVPELAARLHSNAIFDVLENVLREANLKIKDIDYIACTKEPGLIPSLLVGQTVAKTISETENIPFIWINHIEAHMFANFLEREKEEIKFPNVCLTVSGGHNEIYLWKNLSEFELIGQTTDDAAGEAFDKVARILGLGFPGGPYIAREAAKYEGNYENIFPEVTLDKNSLDFSFSGLKSAVNRYVTDLKKNNDGNLTEEQIIKVSFEFEETVCNIFIEKLKRAIEQTGVKNIVISGGVSANSKLREKITKFAENNNLAFKAPVKIIYSMDNAAMIGINAYYKIEEGEI